MKQYKDQETFRTVEGMQQCRRNNRDKMYVCTPHNQCPYQISTSYNLQFLRYSPDNILKFKVITARSTVKSRSNLLIQTISLPSINFLDHTDFKVQGNYHNVNWSNQDHTMKLLMYTPPKAISLQSSNILHLTVSEIEPRQEFSCHLPARHLTA